VLARNQFFFNKTKIKIKIKLKIDFENNLKKHLYIEYNNKNKKKLFISSHSSVGQSVGLMSQRSAVRTRLGAIFFYSSCSVVAITEDLESSNPSSNLGKSYF
jgi:hypothetical protein